MWMVYPLPYLQESWWKDYESLMTKINMNEAVYITLLFNVRNEQTNEKSYIGDALTRHSSMYIITRL